MYNRNRKVIEWNIAVNLMAMTTYLAAMHHKLSVGQSLGVAIAILVVIAIVAGKMNTDRDDISAASVMLAVFGAILSLLVATMPDTFPGPFNRSATLLGFLGLFFVYLANTPWISKEMQVAQKVIMGVLFFQAFSMAISVTFGSKFT